MPRLIFAGRPDCHPLRGLASYIAISTKRIPTRAGCHHVGMKGTHDDGRHRNGNQVAGRAHAAG
jgi:hypothetical protein